MNKKIFQKIIKRIYYVLYKKHIDKFFKHIAYRSVHNNPSLLRLSSSPYISGDSYRKLANHLFDETTLLDPKDVEENDIVFLKTDLKEKFFSEYHNEIKSKYILITHNSDECITKLDTKYIDDKIIHWFAMKLNLPMNSKISPLPAGFENRRYFNNGIIKNFEKVYSNNLKNNNFEKKNQILCSFNINTNIKERAPLIEAVSKRKDVDINNFSNNFHYLNALSLYKFNLCPEGNHFESHRFWETLFFNNIPIVERNNVNENFVQIGIPIIMLEKWEDISNLTIERMVNQYFYNKSEDPRKFIKLDFWKELIYKERI
tara:strand:+ start:1532 stop:2479 length:948 start_codon:yes stop_codon:yes gene_type:complete